MSAEYYKRANAQQVRQRESLQRDRNAGLTPPALPRQRSTLVEAQVVFVHVVDTAVNTSSFITPTNKMAVHTFSRMNSD